MRPPVGQLVTVIIGSRAVEHNCLALLDCLVCSSFYCRQVVMVDGNGHLVRGDTNAVIDGQRECYFSVRIDCRGGKGSSDSEASLAKTIGRVESCDHR